MGEIRLACTECDREDYDGVDKIPPDWFDVHVVQTYEESYGQRDLNLDPRPKKGFLTIDEFASVFPHSERCLRLPRTAAKAIAIRVLACPSRARSVRIRTDTAPMCSTPMI